MQDPLTKKKFLQFNKYISVSNKPQSVGKSQETNQ